MITRIATALVFGAILAGPSDDSIERYVVTGTTPAAMRMALDKARPATSDGKPHDATTRWFVRWRYGTATVQAGCGVSRFDVSLETITTLPDWADEPSAPRPLVRQWARYFQALLVHEAGHRIIGGAAAAALRDAGSRVRPQSQCDLLATEIKRTAEDVLNDYRKRDREYDLETEHGRTQGASFSGY